jgi:hypothetical protein
VATDEHKTTSGLTLRVKSAFAKALTDSWQFNLTIAQMSHGGKCSKRAAASCRQSCAEPALWGCATFGSSMTKGANRTAGGWKLSAITTIATGQPILLTAPNQTVSAFINPLSQRVCNGSDGQLSNNIRNNGMLWFNTSCFPTPPIGYFGDRGTTL